MNSTPAAEERNAKPKQNIPTFAQASEAPKRRRIPAFWIVVTLVVILVGCIWYVNNLHNAATAAGRGANGRHHFGFGDSGMALPVVATAARHGELHVYLNGLGTVTPFANVTVRTQISGVLMSVNFNEGQIVKKGDLLATIDSRPYEVALEQANGQIAQAKAQLTSAKADLDRYQTLAKQDSIAQQQVDAQVALVSQYEGLVETDQAAIDNAKLNIAYCHITAPVGGRVGLRQVDAGNYVTSGDANGIVVLTQIQPITVIFTLPEDNVPGVTARLHSGESIAVDAYDRTQTTKLASGTLGTIDNQVDTTTGTFKLRAVFANADESLFPNQFVNVHMLLDTEHDDIVIPTSAVERGQQGTFAYVVTPDNTATARPITLGNVEGETVSVLSGLKAGELVVSDGADKLKEGSPVIVQKAADAAPTTPEAAAAAAAGGAAGQHHHRRQGPGGPDGAGAGANGGWQHKSGGQGGQSGASGSADADANKQPAK